MDKMLNIAKSSNHAVEEAYRTLRTNIQFCGIDKKIKVVAITSTNPAEGKTTTSINLAVSMAASGMKVLLIDADLRKPMISKRLGTGKTQGVSNYISGYCSLEDIIKSTDIEGMDVITSGPKPPNPAEIIGSSHFKEFVSTVAEMYDIVLIDTPPLGSVIDAALIAACADGTVLVVKSKATDYKNARRVKEQLEKVNARILGVVLNSMDKRYYRSYYGYYKYYYGHEIKQQKRNDKKMFKRQTDDDQECKEGKSILKNIYEHY